MTYFLLLVGAVVGLYALMKAGIISRDAFRAAAWIAGIILAVIVFIYTISWLFLLIVVAVLGLCLFNLITGKNANKKA